MTVREAAPEEREAVVELIRRAFEPITMFRRIEQMFGPFNGRDWQDRFRVRAEKSVDSRTVLVAAEGDRRLAACVLGAYDPAFRLAFLDMLAVAPDCQGQGLGREMVRAFEAWAREQGAEAVHLDCLADNDAGNALYQSEGFEEVTRQVIWFKRLAEPDPE